MHISRIDSYWHDVVFGRCETVEGNGFEQVWISLLNWTNPHRRRDPHMHRRPVFHSVSHTVALLFFFCTLGCFRYYSVAVTFCTIVSQQERPQEFFCSFENSFDDEGKDADWAAVMEKMDAEIWEWSAYVLYLGNIAARRLGITPG